MTTVLTALSTDLFAIAGPLVNFFGAWEAAGKAIAGIAKVLGLFK